jgi:23S rRNA (adenine2503-C2)-methyltransferase
VNDSTEHARALLDLAVGFRARAGKRPRISVIPYNSIDEAARDPFRRSDDARERAFRAVLHDAGLPTHKRYSGGSDVAAACGQLAARS